MDIKWLHAAGHVGDVGPRVVEFAKNLDPLLIDWSEMFKNIDELREHVKNYTHFAGQVVRIDSRGRPVGHDVVLSIRKDADIIHRETFFISHEVKRLPKYFPERHGKAVVVDWQGVRILLVAWHPHPVPFKLPILVLPKYKDGVRRVQVVQRRLEQEYEPDVVLNGGDLQLGEGNQWVHPNNFASRNHMWYRHKGIDWQMAKGKRVRIKDFKVYKPSRINKGMDHPWTMLVLHYLPK